ncbi:MAG: prenyltransferase, partial [Candidatus Gastranaerophilales bacterium]|nr:prenyltransferase [Candidatus Gastranaerophilales bacterium]
FYGLIALMGIVILHLATNIFDDIIDYLREKKLIDKGVKKDFNFQKGKCFCLFNSQLALKDYYIATIILFFLSFLIALFFLKIYGIKLLIIIIPTIILCLLYPVLGCLGLGEVIVAVIFSPLLYSGVFYIMTGSYSLKILLLSISTGLLSVAVLHNHMLLDFSYDTKNRKITICRLCKTQKRALYLLGIIVFGAYLNIFVSVLMHILDYYYFIVFLSLPCAVSLYNVMTIHVKNPNQQIKRTIFMGNTSGVNKVPEEQQNFILKFIIVRNLLVSFTALLCIAIILSEIF